MRMKLMTISGGLIVGVATLLGCESAHERRTQGMMWYRPQPKAGYDSNSFSIGRYGKGATADFFDGYTVSRAGTESSSTYGRSGSAATFGTYGSAASVGDSMHNSAISSRGQESSTSLGVTGGTATTKLGTETSTRVGTGW